VAVHSKLETWWRRASELLAAGDHAHAVRELERLVKAAPQEVAFRYNLSACLFHLGKLDDALRHLRRARQLGLADPTADVLMERIAAQFYAASRLDDAIALQREVLAKWPNDTMRLLRFGEMLRAAGRFAEALELLSRIHSTGREEAYVQNALGLTRQNMGALDAARAHFARALEIDPALTMTHKNIRYLTLNRPGLGAGETFDIYRDLARRGAASSFPFKFDARPEVRDRPLRVAYVSSDFRMHVVGLNILPLIENHDPAEVDLYFYSDVAEDDQVTRRFKARAGSWRPIVGMSDAEAAATIRSDNIDIAVFLAGSFDANRPQIAAYRAAPVQVSYHDCATSGFEAMDYFISDDLLTPMDTPEKFSETIYRLPVLYQYEKRAVPPDLPEPPSLKSGSITFGSFNKPEKINDGVIALWARVLSFVPNSKLMLKYFDFYKGAEAQKRILSEFAKHGIEADRLIFKFGFDVSGVHLSLYDSIDIALDTFPFAGATTTFEALSRGVPVVTLWGDRYVARYAGAIVTHAGCADFACANNDAYIALARALASDVGRLRDLKRTLPAQLAASALCDGAAYARNMETAYREMWSRYLERPGAL
jgi:protein O-GlcNAc transferase